MHTFEAGGHTWIVKVTLRHLEDIEEALGITTDQVLNCLGDFQKTVAAVYWCVKDQAVEREIKSLSEFKDVIEGGDTLGDLVEAFTKALIDFFPKRQRMILINLIEKQREMELKLAEETTSGSAMNSAGSLDSIQEILHIDN